MAIPRIPVQINSNIPPVIDPDTGCWEWQGYVDAKTGYGKVSARWAETGRKVGPTQAHRVFYELYRGVFPKQRQLHHKCENKRCVNPWHLEVMTPRAHGREGTRARLTEEQVREIRKRRRAGERGSVLAKEFGVSQSHICDIAAGRYWQLDVECPHCGHEFDPYAWVPTK